MGKVKTILCFLGLWLIATIGLFFLGIHFYPSHQQSSFSRGAILTISVPDPALEIFIKDGWIVLFSFLLALLFFFIIKMFKGKK